MARLAAEDVARTTRASHIRGRSAADWPRRIRPIQHLSGRRRRTIEVVRKASAPRAGLKAGTRGASGAVRERLAVRHRDYEARFGYIFIVCATGKSAEEMLASLERRLAHNPSDELRVAAQEQRKITRLRIAKLFQ